MLRKLKKSYLLFLIHIRKRKIANEKIKELTKPLRKSFSILAGQKKQETEQKEKQNYFTVYPHVCTFNQITRHEFIKMYPNVDFH